MSNLQVASPTILAMKQLIAAFDYCGLLDGTWEHSILAGFGNSNSACTIWAPWSCNAKLRTWVSNVFSLKSSSSLSRGRNSLLGQSQQLILKDSSAAPLSTVSVISLWMLGTYFYRYATLKQHLRWFSFSARKLLDMSHQVGINRIPENILA